MKNIVSAGVLAGMFLVSGCSSSAALKTVSGSGVAKTEERKVAAFSEIEVSGAADIKVICGKSVGVVVSGDDNIVPLIKTEVEGNTLRIYCNESISPDKDLVITVTAPDVSAIAASGANDIEMVAVNNEALNIDVSGAGEIDLKGSTGALTVHLSGAAELDAKELKGRKVTVDISGAASADVYASEELNAEVSGVGSIDYYGNPAVVHKEVSGVGSINKK